jgi:hypothetical protein
MIKGLLDCMRERAIYTAAGKTRKEKTGLDIDICLLKGHT